MKQQFFTLLFLLSLMSINAQTSSIYELNEEEHFVVLLDGSLLKADNNDYSTKKHWVLFDIFVRMVPKYVSVIT